jgi:hypothetical protein
VINDVEDDDDDEDYDDDDGGGDDYRLLYSLLLSFVLTGLEFISKRTRNSLCM